MAARVEDVEAIDVRFPTSRDRDGSDAMNTAPDYSAAYVVLHVGGSVEVTEGHGFTFTSGRGTEVVLAAVRALAERVRGRAVEEIVGDLGGFARDLQADSQLRWLGPDKGVVHLAAAAIVNAAWDLAGKIAGKPVWRLLAEMSARELVELVDWRYLHDVLSPETAEEMLRTRVSGRAERREHLRAAGYPAYITSAGWLGYSDETLRRLCERAVDDGWDAVKLKVGADLEQDRRRCRIAREAIGPHRRLMIDANQVFGVREAIEWHSALAEFDLWWFEEPTSPDDVLGHAEIQRAIAPTRVATGEHAQNAVLVKQFLNADAMRACQIDPTRLAGVNEFVACLLLAAAHEVPVCPHAGGVGLCELVQHLAIADYVAISGALDGRMVEYVGHLHEHFVDPVSVRGSRYRVPETAGFSSRMHRASLERYRYPTGIAWE